MIYLSLQTLIISINLAFPCAVRNVVFCFLLSPSHFGIIHLHFCFDLQMQKSIIRLKYHFFQFFCSIIFTFIKKSGFCALVFILKRSNGDFLFLMFWFVGTALRAGQNLSEKRGLDCVITFLLLFFFVLVDR